MEDAILLIGVFLAALVVGVLLIVKIPARLHTPLMSMTNAVSGITVLGALLLFRAETTGLENALGVVAIAMGSFNLLGGFAVTHRMLRMFRQKGAPHE
jgi:NAD(P) transhydrogenase subunit alpha